MTRTTDMLKKMCVIGEAAVGKTSLIRRFVVDKFDDKYIATIGTKTSKKTVTIRHNGTNFNLKLMIWDILGQNSFTELQKRAYKGASGAFIVLDLTREETLSSFKSWLLSLYKVAGEVPVVVLANKSDLKVKFGKKDIENLVADYGFPFYLTSAKTGENVNEAFHTLGRMMVKRWAGTRTEPAIDVSEEVEWEIVEEAVPDRALTALEVEDLIMAKFCNLLEDQDYAMAIIREQFKRADVDFKNPTVQGLTKIVDYLIFAASDQIETACLEKERTEYLNLIRRIG